MSQRLITCSRFVVAAIMSVALTVPAAATARRSIRVSLEAPAGVDVDAATLRSLNESMRLSLTQQHGLQVVERAQADFVLWGSVTRLSDRVDRGKREVDCNVSVIVADAVGGSIRLTLAGRAVARGDVRSRVLASQALGAAVRGAITPLERGLGAVLVR
jgi:hypothetical protein